MLQRPHPHPCAGQRGRDTGQPPLTKPHSSDTQRAVDSCEHSMPRADLVRARYAIGNRFREAVDERLRRSAAFQAAARACPPEPCAQVRILPGAPWIRCLKTPPSALQLRTGSSRIYGRAVRLWWPRSVEPALLCAAEEAWADEYSPSQMAPATDVLDVASVLGKALGEVVQRAVARWRVLVCGSHCGTTSASRPNPTSSRPVCGCSPRSITCVTTSRACSPPSEPWPPDRPAPPDQLVSPVGSSVGLRYSSAGTA